MKNTLWGTLYTIDSERIGRIEYMEKDDCFYIKENEKLSGELPERVFILPDYSKFPFLISLCRQSSQEEEEIGTDEAELIGKRIIVKKHENTRADIRIPVSMEMLISNPMFSDPQKVVVHNLSARGLLFASKEQFEVGMEILCSLPISEPALTLTAVVKNKIPMITDNAKDIIGYGCMFLSMDAKIESTIRSYVFKQQLDHRKCSDR